MPKNRTHHDYVTSNSMNGMSWREISEYVTASGDKLSVSGARHVYCKTMKKLAIPLLQYLGHELTDENIDNLSRSIEFQEFVKNIITEEDKRKTNE